MKAVSSLRTSRRDWFWAAYVALAVCAAASAALAYSNRLAFIENPFLDARFGLLAKPASGDIVIVEIDARSIAAAARWPWPRRMHADLLETLSAAGAHLVAFDVDFSARQGPDDELLAAAAANAASAVILAGFRQDGGLVVDAVVDSMPYPALRRHAFIASANVVPESDGVVRRYAGATRVAGDVRPSLAALVAERAGNAGDSFHIDYGIDFAAIPIYSFMDVIEGRVAPERFAGKRVLVGASAIELGDRFAVPRYGVIPGVAVQALAAETLLSGRALWQSDPFVPAALAAFVVLVIGSNMARAGRFLLVAILVPPLLVSAAIAAQAKALVLINLAPALVAWLGACGIAGALFAWQRVASSRETDAATSLPNRLRLASEMKQGIVIAARIRDFDTLVAAFGVDRAALIVRSAADRLLAGSPASRIYRISTDTLALVFEPSMKAAITDWAATRDAVFRDGVVIEGAPVDIGFRYGFADRTGSAEDAIDSALAAIERAQRAGEPWSWNDHSVAEQARWQAGLGTALRSAIASGHIALAYQPKLRVADGRVTRAEALVRWSDPVRGAIAPDLFVPAAEANGSIRDLTRFVLRTAMEQQQAWARRGFDVAVAVNISTVDLGDPGFVEEVAGITAASGARPADLTLEITESGILGSNEQAMRAAHGLRERGFKLSIDDYGTGQSTLAYVQKFPVSELKIDRSFVSRMLDEAASTVLVRSTIDLAHALSMEAVAEGVEDSETFAELALLGCDYVQGYFVSRPVDPETLFGLYASPAAIAA